MKRLFFVFGVALFFSGCFYNKSHDENSLVGTWRLYDVTSKDESNSDFSETANMKKVLKDGAIVCLFKNDSYSEIDNKSEFLSGSWKFDTHSNSITLFPEGLNKNANTVQIGIDSKNATTISIEKGNLLYKYIKESEGLVKSVDDPFYPSNNKWRIKAKEFEDSTKLSNRLANYFKHLALLLSAAKERKQSVVSFEFSQGPVKIYNGGIGIYPYKIVPQAWKNFFYDESNATTAYSLYNDYLQLSHYRGASTGEWMIDDYNILLSIYSDFNKSNEH